MAFAPQFTRKKLSGVFQKRLDRGAEKQLGPSDFTQPFDLVDQFSKLRSSFGPQGLRPLQPPDVEDEPDFEARDSGFGGYDAPKKCTGGPTPGALALASHWNRSTGLGNMGIYNCRNVRGGKTLSVHAEGRAIDLSANARNLNQKATADKYVGWLIKNSGALNVQYLIWNGMSWRPGRGWRRYGGSNPHTNHIHVELNWRGASSPSSMWG